MRRIAVVPASVVPPDIADHELGLVVHRAQIGALHQLLVDLDLMDDPVERHSGVHRLQRGRDEGFERGGHVVEHTCDARASGDRQPVCRQEQLRFERGHRSERVRPLGGIPLHLLRVAGIREHPAEEIARDDRSVLRHPTPGVVVRLPSIVMQLDVEASDVHAQPVGIGDRTGAPSSAATGGWRRRRPSAARHVRTVAG